MSAVVTDQFRISNANNFVDSVLNETSSYYVFLGLPNPSIAGFGRTDVVAGAVGAWPLSPVDNFSYQSHYRDTMMYGKKINSANIRRVVKKHSWVKNNRYDMYRHDYDANNLTPNSKTTNLYRSNFYVMNDDFEVYICLDNGSSGSNLKGNRSLVQPDFTDVEPITLSDGFTWKYLFTIAPSDIIKFDSLEYIVLPNEWSTTTDSQIKSIRESGNSDVNKNQIKKVYVADAGKTGGYQSTVGTDPHILDILGDGTGAKVSISVLGNGTIDSVKVVSGGSGYTYGMVDLKRIQESANNSALGKLIPIIPPSRGHGFDIYKELGADKVLIYARFDDSTKDFPIDSAFAQIGILKNPLITNSDTIFTGNTFSSLDSFKVSSGLDDDRNYPGMKITQTVTGGTARGYVASYDTDTQIVKYFQDRSLYFPNKQDHSDSSKNNTDLPEPVLKFGGTGSILFLDDEKGNQTPSIDEGLVGITTTVDNKIVNLGVSYNKGVAESEINKKTGDVIYITNRSVVQRDLRQKEDIKIVLEF